MYLSVERLNVVGLSNQRRLFELKTYPTVIPFCGGKEDGPDGVVHSPPNPFRYVPFPRIAAPKKRGAPSARNWGRFGRPVIDLPSTISRKIDADAF